MNEENIVGWLRQIDESYIDEGGVVSVSKDRLCVEKSGAPPPLSQPECGYGCAAIEWGHYKVDAHHLAKIIGVFFGIMSSITCSNRGKFCNTWNHTCQFAILLCPNIRETHYKITLHRYAEKLTLARTARCADDFIWFWEVISSGENFFIILANRDPGPAGLPLEILSLLSLLGSCSLQSQSFIRRNQEGSCEYRWKGVNYNWFEIKQRRHGIFSWGWCWSLLKLLLGMVFSVWRNPVYSMWIRQKFSKNSSLLRRLNKRECIKLSSRVVHSSSMLNVYSPWRFVWV